jgi:hypothetical protein
VQRACDPENRTSLTTGELSDRGIIDVEIAQRGDIGARVGGHLIDFDRSAIDIERDPADQDDQGTSRGLKAEDYLSGVALGFQPLPETLGNDAAAAILPVLITASLLFTFKPKGMKW